MSRYSQIDLVNSGCESIRSMMRKSGVSPVVKRWKLACEMLRRAASGHIEATQLLKFAAASRIAEAVIRGWPEAPSSPLQGGGALPVAGAVCACAVAAVGLPEKMLPNRFGKPPPDDCAQALPESSTSPESSSAAASRIVPVRLAIGVPRPMSPQRSAVQKALSWFPIA